MSLDLSDLLILVRLIENEKTDLYLSVENDEGEADPNSDTNKILLVVNQTSAKLKQQYEELWNADSEYPSYDKLLSLFKNSLV